MNIDLPRNRAVVQVITTNHRGFTPEEVASRAADRIVAVSEKASPEIAAQAQAFRDEIEAVLVKYMYEVIASNKTTVYNAIVNAGQPELAKLIWSL